MKFPRRQRFRRDEDFPPMKLTERDEAILKAVHRHRFLRSHQICELIGGSRQQVLRRLQTLFHHGYVERPHCQLDYFQKAGSRSMVYGLANRRTAHLRKISDGYSHRLHSPSRNLSVKRLFLEHALMVSDIMVSLELACRKRGDVRLLIEDEIPLPESTRCEREPFRWTVTASGKVKMGVIPDRVFALDLTGTSERILFFLEADRGTMPVERTKRDASSIARKLHAYAQTWNNGIHVTRFAVSRVRVLTVTLSKSRCDSVRRAASAVSSGHGLFLQTSLTSHFSSETALTRIWMNTSNNTVSLLD